MPGTRSSSRSASSAEVRQAAAFRGELRRFLDRIDMATAEAGLTPQRYDLILALKAAGGESTINQLCAALDMRQTAVTELVKRAEEAELVTRTQSTVDRRVVLVRTTPEAEVRFSRAFAALRADRSALSHAIRALMDALEPADSELHPALEPPPGPAIST